MALSSSDVPVISFLAFPSLDPPISISSASPATVESPPLTASITFTELAQVGPSSGLVATLSSSLTTSPSSASLSPLTYHTAVNSGSSTHPSDSTNAIIGGLLGGIALVLIIFTVILVLLTRPCRRKNKFMRSHQNQNQGPDLASWFASLPFRFQPSPPRSSFQMPKISRNNSTSSSDLPPLPPPKLSLEIPINTYQGTYPSPSPNIQNPKYSRSPYTVYRYRESSVDTPHSHFNNSAFRLTIDAESLDAASFVSSVISQLPSDYARNSSRLPA